MGSGFISRSDDVPDPIAEGRSRPTEDGQPYLPPGRDQRPCWSASLLRPTGQLINGSTPHRSNRQPLTPNRPRIPFAPCLSTGQLANSSTDQLGHSFPFALGLTHQPNPRPNPRCYPRFQHRLNHRPSPRPSPRLHHRLSHRPYPRFQHRSSPRLSPSTPHRSNR